MKAIRLTEWDHVILLSNKELTVIWDALEMVYDGPANEEDIPIIQRLLKEINNASPQAIFP